MTPPPLTERLAELANLPEKWRGEMPPDCTCLSCQRTKQLVTELEPLVSGLDSLPAQPAESASPAEVNSRSQQKRIAAMKGEPAPTFAPAELCHGRLKVQGGELWCLSREGHEGVCRFVGPAVQEAGTGQRKPTPYLRMYSLFKHKAGCKWATLLPTGDLQFWGCDCGLDALLVQLEDYELDPLAAARQPSARPSSPERGTERSMK